MIEFPNIKGRKAKNVLCQICALGEAVHGVEVVVSG